MSDPVQEVQKLLGLEFPESVFYLLAVDVGRLRGRDAENKARELHGIWQKHGFYQLHAGYKKFIGEFLKGRSVI